MVSIKYPRLSLIKKTAVTLKKSTIHLVTDTLNAYANFRLFFSSQESITWKRDGVVVESMRQLISEQVTEEGW